MKQILDLRPVYHRLEERIRAHVVLCWLALLLIASSRPPPARPGTTSGASSTGSTPSPSPAPPGPSASAPTPPSRRPTSTPGSTSPSPRRSSRSPPQGADQARHRRLVTHALRVPSRIPAGQHHNPRTRRSPQLRNAGITTALRSSDVRARSAAETTGQRGRGTESVDNTCEKHVAVDSLRNPPVPQHSRQREVLLLAYLARPGAQQGTAHLSRKSDPGGPLSAWLGERFDPPRRRDGSSYDEERGPQGSVSRASCPQIFDNGPGQRLDARLWTRESRCRDRPAAMPASRADHAAGPGNGREQRGTTQATRLPTPVHQR